MYHLKTFHLRNTEGINQTKGDRRHILTLISLSGFSPAFDNITANIYIGNVGEEGDFTSHAGVLLSPMNRNIPKTDDNDRTHENDAHALS